MHDDDLKWYHFALCQGMNDLPAGTKPHKHTDPFFEGYEDDSVMAGVMDGICSSCPVRRMCLKEGIENGETGLWGGVFLINGKMDETRNSHKTPDDWENIRELITR